MKGLTCDEYNSYLRERRLNFYGGFLILISVVNCYRKNDLKCAKKKEKKNNLTLLLSIQNFGKTWKNV